MTRFRYALAVFVVAAVLPVRAELTTSSPDTVCQWLDGRALYTKGWKNLFDEHYYCQSDDRMIGQSLHGALQSNLVYSVEGNKTTVERVKLLLDIYDRWGPSGKAEAKTELLKALRVLAEKASGQPLPASISQAVEEELFWVQQLGPSRVKVIRDPFPSGIGYSIKVTIE